MPKLVEWFISCKTSCIMNTFGSCWAYHLGCLHLQCSQTLFFYNVHTIKLCFFLAEWVVDCIFRNFRLFLYFKKACEYKWHSSIGVQGHRFGHIRMLTMMLETWNVDVILELERLNLAKSLLFIYPFLAAKTASVSRKC